MFPVKWLQSKLLLPKNILLFMDSDYPFGIFKLFLLGISKKLVSFVYNFNAKKSCLPDLFLHWSNYFCLDIWERKLFACLSTNLKHCQPGYSKWLLPRIIQAIAIGFVYWYYILVIYVYCNCIYDNVYCYYSSY